MEDWQVWVVAERDELREKAERLAAFLDSPACFRLLWAEQDRLKRQLRLMNDYREVLDERIAVFSGNIPERF